MGCMDVTDAAARADWAQTATALAPRLLRLAVMLTGSSYEAEDLLQSTFARAQRHGDRIAAMAAPAAYLRTIMVNEHVSRHRRRRLRTVPLSDALELPAAPAAETGPDLWPWLATLPRQQRAVLVLRYYEDLPDGEIAALVGCSPATVRSHASHGLAKLRTLLTDEESR
ncbi:MAG: polymerase, sigma-24 subunit, subfamily [Nocardioides sp.]|jgi:RNA polymerase sigma-70 factor (sigma-E family)|nr:polymerase, sigma-24 subunit, subfamily [Nocardioides sp.]